MSPYRHIKLLLMRHLKSKWVWLGHVAFIFDFWVTVRKTVRPMLSVRCLFCLSVTLVHCGQTVGRIKIKLGVGSGHIVLDGDPALPPPKGHSPPPPIFGPYLLWPSGCMDQDVTWYGARPRPRRLCVRWGAWTTSIYLLHGKARTAHSFEFCTVMQPFEIRVPMILKFVSATCTFFWWPNLWFRLESTLQ